MPGGEDWLMRPVMHGLCRYESLKGTELDLADFARMNDAIDIDEVNRKKLAEQGARKGG